MTTITGVSRYLLSAIVCVGFAAGLVACGGDDDDSSASSSGDAEVSGGASLACKDGGLTVGIAKAESGGASFFDIAGTRGAKIAFDQINAKGGIKGCQIKVIKGDTKSDPAVAAQVARDLIGQGAQILFVAGRLRPRHRRGACRPEGGRADAVGGGVVAPSSPRPSATSSSARGPTTTQLGNGPGAVRARQGVGRRRSWSSTRASRTSPSRTGRRLQRDDEAGGDGRGHRQGRVARRPGRLQLHDLQDQGGQPAARRDQRPDDLPAGRHVREAAAGRRHRHAGDRQRDAADRASCPSCVGAAGSNDIYYSRQVYFEGAGEDPDSDPDIDRVRRRPTRKKFGEFPEQANGPGSYRR